MIRVAHADPADPGIARQRDRGLRGAADDEVSVVAAANL